MSVHTEPHTQQTGSDERQGAPLPTSPVIEVRDLRMAYGSYDAVSGIDLEVQRGEVFAFLGPNGAGKTTTVEILEGFRNRTGGKVSVLGEDPWQADAKWRACIGVVLQESAPEPELTVEECLSLYAGYYPSPGESSKRSNLSVSKVAARRDAVTFRVDSAGAWTWRSRSSATHKCCSSTNRRPGLIPRLVAPPGRSFRDSVTSGRRSS